MGVRISACRPPRASAARGWFLVPASASWHIPVRACYLRRGLTRCLWLARGGLQLAAVASAGRSVGPVHRFRQANRTISWGSTYSVPLACLVSFTRRPVLPRSRLGWPLVVSVYVRPLLPYCARVLPAPAATVRFRGGRACLCGLLWLMARLPGPAAHMSASAVSSVLGVSFFTGVCLLQSVS